MGMEKGAQLNYDLIEKYISVRGIARSQILRVALI
jgi:hypothetical protein